MSCVCPAGNSLVTMSVEIYQENYTNKQEDHFFVVVSLVFLLLGDSRIERIFDITTVVHIQGAILTTVRAGFSFLSLKESLNSD